MNLSVDKTLTHRGRLKKDVWKEFTTAVKNKQLDNTMILLWELAASGQTERIVNHIVTTLINDIGIRTCCMLSQIHSFYTYFLKRHSNHGKIACDCYRDQTVVNFMFWAIPIWYRINTEPLPKLPKITTDDMNLISKKDDLLSKDLTNIRAFFKVDDPKHCMIPISEICELFEKRDNYANLPRVLYWIHWILFYERQSKKPIVCSSRNNTMIDMKFRTDIIWLIWEVVLKYAEESYTNDVANGCEKKQAVQGLYELFSIHYTKQAKKQRLHFLILAISIIFSTECKFIMEKHLYYHGAQYCIKSNVWHMKFLR